MSAVKRKKNNLKGFLNNVRATIKISDALEKTFNVEKMGTGLKRGLVLKITPAKIKDLLKTSRFKNDVESIKLNGEYENPQLRIYMKPGSIWRIQIHQQRCQLKKKINERLKSEFIRDIRVF